APASLAVITKSLGRNKTAMGISMHSIIRRFPMAVGPLIGGFLIAHYGLLTGIKICFGLSIVLCLVGLLFQQKISGGPEKDYERIQPWQLWKQTDARLRNILLSDILIRFCEQIPFVFVVLWCIDEVGVSAQQFGTLTAIEMATAALIYIPVASFSDR